MFEIKYQMANDDGEIIDTDEVSLRTKHFLGNLLLRNERFCIFIDQQKVPIVDSAFNIIKICSALVRTKDDKEDFEFSHSDKKITFKRNEGKVIIIPSFSVVTLEIPVEDFKEGTKLFFKNVMQDVMKKNHSLKMNALLFGYLTEADKI